MELVLEHLEKQLDEVKRQHSTEHRAPDVEWYWRGVRIGLETAISTIKDVMAGQRP